MKSLCAGLAAILCATLPARAQVVGPGGPPDSPAWLQCKGKDTFYSESSPNISPHVAEIFAGHGASLIVRSCHDYEGHVHYFIREPADAGAGVCRFSDEEMFVRTGKSRFTMPVMDPVTGQNLDLENWDPLPPTDWAARHYPRWYKSFAYIKADDNEACPPLGDARYFMTSHVTDGLLRSFGAFWREASVSPEAFDRTFVKTGFVDFGNARAVPKLNPQGINGFRQQTFSRHPPISSVYCIDGSDANGGAGGGCSAIIGQYAVNFDAGVSGLVIASVAVVPVI